MSPIADLPILTVFPGVLPFNAAERLAEREVDRNMLAAISPDRDELLLSKRSMDELRQALKLRTDGKDHWLYNVKHSTNANFHDATTRTSTLIQRISQDEHKAAAVRRVLSTSSLNRSHMPFMRIDNGIPGRTEADGVNVWGSFLLSTGKKLVSPRPLDPTHLLIVHDAPLSIHKSGKKSFPRHGAKLPHIDVPINDLLFLMSAPNVTGLPHRMHQQLPRAVLCVPHLETFPAVVVYLHTMNQAELFRTVVPEWMRDIMHPLLLLAPLLAPKEAAPSILSPKKQRGPASLFSKLSAPKVASSASSMHSVDTISSGFSGHSSTMEVPERLAMVDSIAQDIVDGLPFFSDEDPASDVLVSTLKTLNALKANLQFLGYFGKVLWDELDAYVGILTRAVVLRASLTAPAAN